MTQTVQNGTAELLQTVYRSVKDAEERILDLMPSVRDEQLKSDLTVQISAFEAFASRAAKHLAEEGAKPEEAGMLARAKEKMRAVKEGMRDASAAHLAEVLIESTTAGAASLLHAIRDAENGRASEASLRLARDACAYEEKVAKELKSYL